MTPGPCEQVRQCLGGILHSSEEKFSPEVEEHLQHCVECQGFFRALVWQDRMLFERAARQDAEFSNLIRARLKKSVRDSRAAGWKRTAALAACLLIAFFSWQVLRNSFLLPEPKKIPGEPAPAGEVIQARLEGVQGSVFVLAGAGKREAQTGQALLPGEILRVGEESRAVLACSDRTRLKLEGDTTLSWGLADPQVGQVQEPRFLLTEGSLTAEISEPSENPMVISTPQAQVKASNADFFLCHSAHSTQVESTRGVVNVQRLQDGEAAQVGSGEIMEVSPAEPFLKARPVGPAITQPLASWTQKQGILRLAVGGEGSTVLAGNIDGSVTVWDLPRNAAARQIAGFGKPVRTLALSRDEQWLALGRNRQVQVLNFQMPTQDPNFKVGNTVPFATEFTPDGKNLLACGFDRLVHRFNLETGQADKPRKLTGYRSDFDFPAAMLFSSSTRWLAWGMKDRTARLWDLTTFTEARILRRHEDAITALAFSPTESLLATGSRDRTVILWELATGKLLNQLRGHRHTVQALAFSPDGQYLASGSTDTTVKIWTIAGGHEISTLRGHKSPVTALAYLPDGTLLSSGTDGLLLQWKGHPAP